MPCLTDNIRTFVVSPMVRKSAKNFFLQKCLVISNYSSTFASPEPAKPLNDAQMCGSFYFYTMSNRIPFQKPYTSAHDLVCLLQSRGLTVADTAKAESYLEYTGYYRLSAYMYPLLQMPKAQHRYKPDATFYGCSNYPRCKFTTQ